VSLARSPGPTTAFARSGSLLRRKARPSWVLGSSSSKPMKEAPKPPPEAPPTAEAAAKPSGDLVVSTRCTSCGSSHLTRDYER